MRSVSVLVFVSALVGSGPNSLSGQAPPSGTRIDAPRFADPDRREKLARAFTEIDRAFVEFTTRDHIPGAAWGIVIDGELAHNGVTGSSLSMKSIARARVPSGLLSDVS